MLETTMNSVIGNGTTVGDAPAATCSRGSVNVEARGNGAAKEEEHK